MPGAPGVNAYQQQSGQASTLPAPTITGDGSQQFAPASAAAQLDTNGADIQPVGGVAAIGASGKVVDAAHQHPFPPRATASHTTAVLAAGASEQSTITLASAYRLISIQTNAACRVRLYDRAAKQAADLGRAVGTLPAGDHGCDYEWSDNSTVPLLAMNCAPQPIGASMEAAPSAAIPITVTNLTGSAVAFTVTFAFQAQE